MKKTKLIQELANLHHITAYEIAKNTSISINTAANVLKNGSVKAKEKTLDEILNFIENKITGSKAQFKLQPEIALQQNQKFEDLPIEDKLNEIYQAIQELKTLM